MGRKKISNKKKKGSQKVFDTDLTTGRTGQPEETGHSGDQPPIKIKLKRLASLLPPHAILQPGHGKNKPLHPIPEHDPDIMCSQETQEDPVVIDQEMEAMLSGSPFTYSPGTPNLTLGYGTQTTDLYVINPDSTTDIPPTIDTEMVSDT